MYTRYTRSALRGEEMDLLSFMQENCKYVTEEEQKELDNKKIDFSFLD